MISTYFFMYLILKRICPSTLETFHNLTALFDIPKRLVVVLLVERQCNVWRRREHLLQFVDGDVATEAGDVKFKWVARRSQRRFDTCYDAISADTVRHDLDAPHFGHIEYRKGLLSRLGFFEIDYRVSVRRAERWKLWSKLSCNDIFKQNFCAHSDCLFSQLNSEGRASRGKSAGDIHCHYTIFIANA